MPSDSPTMATGTAEWEDSLRIATLEQSCCVMLCFVFLFDIYFGKSKTQRRTWTSNLSSDALFYSLRNSWDLLARSLRRCCSLLFLTTHVLEATSSLDPRTVNRTHAICSFFHGKRYLISIRTPYELSGKGSELNKWIYIYIFIISLYPWWEKSYLNWRYSTVSCGLRMSLNTVTPPHEKYGLKHCKVPPI